MEIDSDIHASQPCVVQYQLKLCVLQQMKKYAFVEQLCNNTVRKCSTILGSQ